MLRLDINGSEFFDVYISSAASRLKCTHDDREHKVWPEKKEFSCLARGAASQPITYAIWKVIFTSFSRDSIKK